MRLAKDHPLPDGNKRAAWVSLRMFVEINGWRWEVAPLTDEAGQVMFAIAAGEWHEAQIAEWLRHHIANV